MSRTQVIIRGYGDEPLVRTFFGIEDGMVLVTCDDFPGLVSVGFHPRNVFEYRDGIIVRDNDLWALTCEWSDLKRFDPEGDNEHRAARGM